MNVASSVDLSFDEVTMLFAKINEKGRIDVTRSRGYYIMEELIDLLADSARDGENIEPIVNQLTLAPAYQVKLKAATLPAPEGVRIILDCNAALLSDLDALTTDLIVQKLTALLPERGKIAHYRELFNAASQTNDARMIPLLIAFQNHPDGKIRYKAIMSLEAMENQTLYPPFP